MVEKEIDRIDREFAKGFGQCATGAGRRARVGFRRDNHPIPSDLANADYS